MSHCIALGTIAMATQNSEDMNHVGTTIWAWGVEGARQGISSKACVHRLMFGNYPDTVMCIDCLLCHLSKL